MNVCVWEKKGEKQKNNNTSYAVMISGKMNEHFSIFNITQNDLRETKQKVVNEWM